MYGNLPNLTMCAQDRVKWHFIGMGGVVDTHPIYLHGQTLISRNHRKDTITVFPASMEDAFMVAQGAGEWMLNCQIHGKDLFLSHYLGSNDFQGYKPLQIPHSPNGKTAHQGGDRIAFWKVSDKVRDRPSVSDSV